MESDAITVLDAVQELRRMAASLQVDNGGYKLKLLMVADWIENTYAHLLVSKAITLYQPPLPESEMIRRQEEVIKALQHDIALLREQLVRTREDNHLMKEAEGERSTFSPDLYEYIPARVLKVGDIYCPEHGIPPGKVTKIGYDAMWESVPDYLMHFEYEGDVCGKRICDIRPDKTVRVYRGDLRDANAAWLAKYGQGGNG